MKIPINTAVELAQGNGIKLGWRRCRIKLLEKLKHTCYRSQGNRYMAISCTGEQKYYKCGKSDHIAKECTAPPRGEVTDDKEKSSLG